MFRGLGGLGSEAPKKKRFEVIISIYAVEAKSWFANWAPSSPHLLPGGGFRKEGLVDQWLTPSFSLLSSCLKNFCQNALCPCISNMVLSLSWCLFWGLG